MTLQSVRRPILLLPGVLLVLIWVAAMGQAPAPLSIPTLPGVGFAIMGIAPGETLRLNALNSGPVVPLQDPAGCQVALQFHDSEGQLVKEKVIPGLQPGKAIFLDLSRDELPGDGGRTEVRAVLHFGYFGGANPGPEILRHFNCNILPSMEVFVNETGKTSVISTDAKPLPAPFPPPA